MLARVGMCYLLLDRRRREEVELCFRRQALPAIALGHLIIVSVVVLNGTTGARSRIALAVLNRSPPGSRSSTIKISPRNTKNFVGPRAPNRPNLPNGPLKPHDTGVVYYLRFNSSSCSPLCKGSGGHSPKCSSSHPLDSSCSFGRS